LFVIEYWTNKKFLWTEIVFKKVTIKVHNESSEHNLVIFLTDTWQKYSGNIECLFKITRQLALCFWPTKKRSQPYEGDFFAWNAL
jgi:hypothetical protein